jgi:hypothetical protein
MKNLLQSSVKFFTLLIFCAPALSQEREWVQPHFFTGEKLLRACNADMSDGVSTGVCLGYITGVVDASSGIDTHAVKEDGTVLLPLCLPESISNNGILKDIVVKYMREHPAGLQKPAVYLVQGALSSFGCKTGWPDGIHPPNKNR